MGRIVTILGLDPASQKFGYGVIRSTGARLEYVECGVLEAAASLGKYKRMAIIGAELEKVVEEFHPDEAALEAGFVKGQMGALVSGAARGVGAYVCERRGVSVVEYPPSTVKKAATSYGAADKASVARMVQLILRMNVAPVPDAADALAVAICHAHRPTGVLLKR